MNISKERFVHFSDSYRVVESKWPVVKKTGYKQSIR